MGARGLSEAFARQVYQQILGFGEYGFPESHSAAFALLVYVSAWLKHYEPAAFCGALLNSLPMGFYGPSQLVQDARRHGVDVRPVDAIVSEWDCTLEAGSGTASPPNDANPGPSAAAPALRLGLRMIGGLSEAGAQRIVAARRTRAFDSVADLARRGALDARDLARLAGADALAALAGHRHDAAWDVAGVERLPPLLAGGTFAEGDPALAAPTEGQDIVADYRALSLTLRRHPLALLRAQLSRQRLLTAAEVAQAPHGRIVRTAGIVIGRQRPDTASGVVFVTLEDETGATNVIVWRDLGDRQRRELLGAKLLAVYGNVEREGQVVHVQAGRLADLSPMLGKLQTKSRDFH
jgi:error-prone DNA polymerase